LAFLMFHWTCRVIKNKYPQTSLMSTTVLVMYDQNQYILPCVIYQTNYEY